MPQLNEAIDSEQHYVDALKGQFAAMSATDRDTPAVVTSDGGAVSLPEFAEPGDAEGAQYHVLQSSTDRREAASNCSADSNGQNYERRRTLAGTCRQAKQGTRLVRIWKIFSRITPPRIYATTTQPKISIGPLSPCSGWVTANSDVTHFGAKPKGESVTRMTPHATSYV